MTDNIKKIDPILKGLSSVMKKEGFVKKSNNWYLNADETILVVNIQSSGNCRYINFGVWIKKLANKEYIDWFKQYNKIVNQKFPRHYQCHIYFRPVHFPADIDPIAEEVFNLDSRLVSDEEREKYIIEWLNAYELPLLKQCSTAAGIVKAINEYKLRLALVRIEIKPLIIPFLLSVLNNLLIKKRRDGIGNVL